MSASEPTSLDIGEQQVRIERNRVEIRKLLAGADTVRFGRSIAPILAAASVVVSIAALLRH